MKYFLVSAFVGICGALTVACGITLLAAEPNTAPATQIRSALLPDPKHQAELRTAFNAASSSRADLHDFIKQNPTDKDWCGKALLQIGEILEKDGKLQEAIDNYQETVKDYGPEFVPAINAKETVADYANLRAGLCYHKLGKTGEALKLLDAVSQSKDSWNIPKGARHSYLLIKQEKYELKGRITSEIKKLAINKQQAVTVEIRNSSDVPLTLQLSVQLTNLPQAGAGAVFTRGADSETIIKPGETLTKDLTFSAETLKGLAPGDYYLVLRTDGVKLTADAVSVMVVNQASTQPATSAANASKTQESALAGFDELSRDFQRGLDPKEDSKLVLFKQSMRDSIKSGWRPPWSDSIPAYTDKQLHEMTTIDLAHRLFSGGVPARTMELYDDPNKGIARLEVVYPGYGELFSRSDRAAAMLELVSFFGSQLDPGRDDKSNLNAMMVIKTMAYIYMYPAIRKEFVGSERKLIEANLRGLESLQKFVHDANASSSATTRPAAAPNFALHAANALINSSLLFGSQLSAETSRRAYDALAKCKVSPDRLGDVETYISLAINSLQPLLEADKASGKNATTIPAAPR